MLARLSFTDFDGSNFLKNTLGSKKLDNEDLKKYAPNIVDGVSKLKEWSNSLQNHFKIDMLNTLTIKQGEKMKKSSKGVNCITMVTALIFPLNYFMLGYFYGYNCKKTHGCNNDHIFT